MLRSALALSGLCLAVSTSIASSVAVRPDGTIGFAETVGVPPGVNGNAPTIKVVYGSRANGPLGFGWSLQAGSAISRCGGTKSIDGSGTGVGFLATDKLCLDGERLVAVDGAGTPIVGQGIADAGGWADGTFREFRVANNSYSRIRAYGYAGNDTSGASGPKFFRVWTKSGKIYEYGDIPTATALTNASIKAQGKTAVAVWALARIADPSGFPVEFKYYQRNVTWGSGDPGFEWNIAEIQYSGNKVVFTYDADQRQDKSEAYHSDSRNVSVRLLSSITTYINSRNSFALGPSSDAVLVGQTRFAYDVSPNTVRTRLRRMENCAGIGANFRCLPAREFDYSSGPSDAYLQSSSFNLSSTPLHLGSSGSVIPEDLNGDGRTDLLKWSDDPSQNGVWLSRGDGGFDFSPAGLQATNLFHSNGCYLSAVVDVNGDGIADVLRYSSSVGANGSSCASYGPSLVLINNGSGSFSSAPISGVTLRRDSGMTFLPIDYNGDGKIDIITSIPATYVPPPRPGIDFGSWKCTDPSLICTRLYRGNGDGTFTEVSTNVSSSSIYSSPTTFESMLKVSLGWRSRIANVDGDRFQDILPYVDGDTRLLKAIGVRSRGDGNFDAISKGSPCSDPIDYNGDGRFDCLVAAPSQPSFNSLYLGANQVSTFNLVNQELRGPNAGIIISDINGDGYHDILRWKSGSSASNLLYLSRGDGSFAASNTFNLANVPFATDDNSLLTITGDFFGRGRVDFLRLSTPQAALGNLLFTRDAGPPPDLLVRTRTGTGAVTEIGYAALTESNPGAPVSPLGSRYTTDRGTSDAAVFPVVDVTLPLYVAATVLDDTGVGSSRRVTDFKYYGLKFDSSTGFMGFRQTRQQSPAPSSQTISRVTNYLFVPQYQGMEGSTEIHLANLGAITSSTALKTSVNLYCDELSAAGAYTTALSSGAHCPISGAFRRPYLLRQIVSGRDLDGSPIPTTTTTTVQSPSGEPTSLLFSATGNVAGNAFTSTKTITNTYETDDTACSDYLTCNWRIGRLKQTVENRTVTDLTSVLTASAGNAANASAVMGSGPGLTTLTGTPSPLNIGTVGKGLSRTMNITITNSGASTALDLAPSLAQLTGSLSSGGRLSVTQGTCTGTSLAPGASCAVTVRFQAACNGGSATGRFKMAGVNYSPLTVDVSASTSSSGVCN